MKLSAQVAPLYRLAINCRVIVICGRLDGWHWVPSGDLSPIIPGSKVEGAQPMWTIAAGMKVPSY